MSVGLLLLAVLSAFLGLIVIGVPVYVAMMALAIVMLLSSGVSVAGIGQHALDHLNSPVLVAIPFFMLTAVVMRSGGIARVLFEAALCWLGRVRGGAGIAAVGATALFAAINGSSVSTAMAMGTLLVPLLIERGYPQSFATGMTAAAATLGILIPPSLPMILIGIIAEASIPRLFLAGLVPGILQALFFAAYIAFFAPYPGKNFVEAITRRERWSKTGFALPALLLPVIVLGGIYSGAVALTEASVLGAVLALGLVLFVYQTERPADLVGLFTETLDRTAVFIVKIIGAALLSLWIIKSGLPQQAADFIVQSGLKPWQFLMLMNVALLVAGMFIDGVTIILIVLPVLAPVVRMLGIDIMHFGVLLVMNIEIALLTPPIGLNLYVMASSSGRPLGEVARGAIPFLIIMVGLLFLVTYLPVLTTWLPNLVYR